MDFSCDFSARSRAFLLADYGSSTFGYFFIQSSDVYAYLADIGAKLLIGFSTFPLGFAD